MMPADHQIDEFEKFAAYLSEASIAAEQGYLVTFGASIDRPETGYGYVKPGNMLPKMVRTHYVDEFVEKPSIQLALEYCASGKYLWNSGLFLFKPSKYLEEMKNFSPELASALNAAWIDRTFDMNFIRPGKEFENCPSISIDYAVMQKTKNAAVVPIDLKWSDIGSWDLLWSATEKNEAGNAVMGDVFAIGSKDCYLRSESRFLAVVGLENVVVVETKDAVLVMNKDQAQNVKSVIEHLNSNRRKEHMESIKVLRPWGWYEGIDQGHRFQVKRIMVKPGGSLSLQMHHHRAEHWIVVSGTAKVTINGNSSLISENQSTFIPIGQHHRLENPGKIPLYLIEVQSGAYLDEDDIVRFEDAYQRS